MAQMIEHLPSMCQVLGSIFSTASLKKKKDVHLTYSFGGWKSNIR
jgi:hypothetical protein